MTLILVLGLLPLVFSQNCPSNTLPYLASGSDSPTTCSPTTTVTCGSSNFKCTQSTTPNVYLCCRASPTGEAAQCPNKMVPYFASGSLYPQQCNIGSYCPNGYTCTASFNRYGISVCCAAAQPQYQPGVSCPTNYVGYLTSGSTSVLQCAQPNGVCPDSRYQCVQSATSPTISVCCMSQGGTINYGLCQNNVSPFIPAGSSTPSICTVGVPNSCGITGNPNGYTCSISTTGQSVCCPIIQSNPGTCPNNQPPYILPGSTTAYVCQPGLTGSCDIGGVGKYVCSYSTTGQTICCPTPNLGLCPGGITPSATCQFGNPNSCANPQTQCIASTTSMSICCPKTATDPGLCPNNIAPVSLPGTSTLATCTIGQANTCPTSPSVSVCVSSTTGSSVCCSIGVCPNQAQPLPTLCNPSATAGQSNNCPSTNYQCVQSSTGAPVCCLQATNFGMCPNNQQPLTFPGTTTVATCNTPGQTAGCPTQSICASSTTGTSVCCSMGLCPSQAQPLPQVCSPSATPGQANGCPSTNYQCVQSTTGTPVCCLQSTNYGMCPNNQQPLLFPGTTTVATCSTPGQAAGCPTQSTCVTSTTGTAVCCGMGLCPNQAQPLPQVCNPTPTAGQTSGCPSTDYQCVQSTTGAPVCCLQPKNYGFCPNAKQPNVIPGTNTVVTCSTPGQTAGCPSQSICTSSTTATAVCCSIGNCPNGSPVLTPPGFQQPLVCSVGSTGVCPASFNCQTTSTGMNFCCSSPIVNCPANQPAFGQCTTSSTCPTSAYTCSSGQCCPQPICLNGVYPSAPCRSNTDCQANSVCIASGCCPSPPKCPDNSQPIQTCAIGTNPQCPTGSYCSSMGTCCQLPICPSGQSAIQPCQNQQCPSSLTCVNGGCCLAAVQQSCPFNIAPLGLCMNGACGQGFQCNTGSNVCCPPSTCPNGVQPLGACINSFCDGGFTCVSGLCCPAAQSCPNSAYSYGACSNGQCQSPGFFCANNQCCPGPGTICPDGSQAVGSCLSGTCGVGFSCQSGLCCQPSQSNICPGNNAAIGPCLSGLCGVGYSCFQGVCCQMTSVCPDQSIPLADCSITGFCANGVCLNGMCCQSQQATVCSDGSQSIGPCLSGLCGVGYICNANGMCCPSGLSTSVCPNNGLSLGPCSGGLCPQGFQCVTTATGTNCCSTASRTGKLPGVIKNMTTTTSTTATTKKPSKRQL